MSDYISLEELKATLETTGTTYADSDAAIAITTASETVNDICGRRFYADEVDPSNEDANFRVYTPSTSGLCWIDDLIDLVSLKVDRDGDGTYETTWTLGTHFTLAPVNAPQDDKPHTFVKAKRARGHKLPAWDDSVKVTGQFGWATVPAGVKAATTILAVRITRRMREAPFGIVMSGPDGEAMRIARNDPDVMGALHGLVRNRPF